MSFTRLDNGEFPPLEQAIDKTSPTKKSKAKNKLSMEFNKYEVDKDQELIVTGSDFFKCRTGFWLKDSNLELQKVLESNRVGHQGDFIVVPIRPKRSQYYTGTELDTLPDLILPCEIWHTRIALEIPYPRMLQYDSKIAQQFENLLGHALYMPASAIIVTCPDTDIIHISAISSINNKLSEVKKDNCHPLVLFRVPSPLQLENISDTEGWENCNVSSKDDLKQISTSTTPNKSISSSKTAASSESNCPRDYDQYMSNCSSTSWTTDSGYQLSLSQEARITSKTICPWQQWNAIRSHIKPDAKFGVCLEVADELFEDEQGLERWKGEPVRLIVLHTDQFIRTPGQNVLRLPPKCREFLKQLVLANSLKTGFVVEGSQKADELREYLEYLDLFAASLKNNYLDPLRSWDDRIQPPLQPLSMNLDSGTYGVFEMDTPKYVGYRNAMIAAIGKLILENNRPSREFVLMVLGAGRGPLVDAMIQAIKEVNKECKFKIFALDKNPSSVKALRYKKKFEWDIAKSKDYETQVIESDMRTWEPGVKADLIASELLGSLADNELSPECLDGVWRFATSDTISIPQDYSSYIAPICSYKMHQELYKLRDVEMHPYDQIYVVRLRNYYQIDSTQQLFHFQHHDLSLEPNTRCNSRYTKLVFCSKVDTVCHGFAGYFSTKLFGSVYLSTVIDKMKTPDMESWFPAFIPLQRPIAMSKGALLIVHFWRKENNSSVWYEWVVVEPQRTRLHGFATSMSKFI